MKVLETIFLLILIAIIMAAANMVGYNVDVFVSLQGMGILVLIAITGFFISKVPLLNKLPVILWVSIVAAFVSSSVFPYHEEIITLTNKVNLMAVCTPVLAYAGLSIGKDLVLFKNISWRILPIAIAVFSGTFIFAALIAQVTLHLEGFI